MSKKSIAQSDEEKRTSAMGLFNFAESYWLSAVALRDANVKATHPGSPIEFLYYHAIELYLKSYLRAKECSVSDLLDIGHKFNRLADSARERGLQLDEHDSQLLSSFASQSTLLNTRYIVEGFYRRPTHETLNRTCESLRQNVGIALKHKGIMVRI